MALGSLDRWMLKVEIAPNGVDYRVLSVRTMTSGTTVVTEKFVGTKDQCEQWLFDRESGKWTE